MQSCLAAIGGRWRTAILWQLFPGPVRFADLRRTVPGISAKVLTDQLRGLAADGIVVHRDDGYALSAKGAALRPVIDAMCAWGAEHPLPTRDP
jgi:DNA-binding HxlR family transcriptional regulator